MTSTQITREYAASAAYANLLDANAVTSWRQGWDTGVEHGPSDVTTESTATFIATAQKMPEYPCDICGQDVAAGERVLLSDHGLTVEHTTCVSGWFRRSFGREALSS